MEEILHRPRRSVLYVPGSNEKAQGKISSLEVDALIYDLEELNMWNSEIKDLIINL